MPTLSFVPIDQIKVPQRYRVDFGDMEVLVESIKEKGLIQPITLSPDFRLLAGERRYRACKTAGLTEIPALIRDLGDSIDEREVELFENIHRLGFAYAEEAKLTQEIDRLYREKNIDWNQRKTAQLLDRGLGTVNRNIQLAEAIDVFPELATCKDQAEAFKVLKKMEERAIVGELRKRQLKDIDDGNLEKGVTLALKLAATNYCVGDTFKGLAELPTGGTVSGWTHWHVIECDSPYGIDLTKVKSSKDNAASNIHTYNEIDKEEYPNFLSRLTKELFRVAGSDTHLIFWFGPSWQYEVLNALKEAGWSVDDIPCIWTKPQGQTLQPQIYLARAYEPFFLAWKGKPAIIKEGRTNVFNFSPVPGTRKYHPTERPVQLLEEILATFAVPRCSVLVPFLGSGATLRAAYNLGLNGLGWDLNPEYRDRFLLAIEEDSRTLNGEEIATDEGGEDDEAE